MRSSFPVIFLLLFILLTPVANGHSVFGTDQTMTGKLFEKEEITILITDSGLGGVAVCADIEQRLRSEHPFRNVKIIFCNALPESDYGYNSMGSTAEKVRIFSDALSGMTKWYAPDIILIACNTLSVLYDQTEYSRNAAIPVISIVETGVRLMNGFMTQNPSASVIIFGTETTIEADSHRSLLREQGISDGRIVTQACPDLAGEIQSDAGSDAVSTMIGFYADEAAAKLRSDTGPVAASLCCTHYGYSAEQFRNALTQSVRNEVTLIDPTRSMSDVIFPKAMSRKFDDTRCSVTIVSRAEITQQEIRSIAPLIARRSAPTAAALEAFTLKKDLFTFSRK